MTKNNVRIAIRDSTDSHSVGFFDNVAGIKYKKAEIQRFLAGSASILTLQYNSKDIDSIRSGCKLAFRYKARDYWLNIMKFEKQGFEVEITACSLHLELNNEERGAHKPDKAMSFAEYLAYYDPEHSVTLDINQVSDKKIKLEWTGTDTILARLFSIANSFDAELEFVTELNDDYSLKRHVLNVYKKGNLGSNKTSSPVRVGKELKVINYSDSIEDLRTAVRATGKDGLTINGLNKKIYDDNKELLYYSSGDTVYAPQSRDRFPSVGQASNDNWIVKDLGETEYETKEGLWGYMYGEIQKICLPKIEYKVSGAINSDVGDTQTLIDDVHYEPPLYLKARVSELTDDILQGKVIDSTFINFERQYSQIADSLLKQVEALAEDAAPYIVRLSTDNGYNFKNGQGTSTITAKLEKYSKIVNADWKWLINNSIVSETSSVTINASQVTGTLNVVAVASVDGNEVAREYITCTNSDDGVGIKSIKRYYTTNNQAEDVTAGGQNWSTKPTTVTAENNYMWSYDVITYTNDTSLVTEPAVIGARGDDGLDADTTGITEALDKAKQELTALSANIEKVRDDSLAAVAEAKQQLTTVANDLSTAKQDLQSAVSAVDTKATNLQSDLTKAKQDLTSQASQLTAQANAQSELTKRVSTVEETANGTKTTVSELSKTVDSNTKNITSVTARTKTVEDDLLNTKTTLSQVKTAADNTSQKTATLETGLTGLTAKFENLQIGTVNLLHNSKGPFKPNANKIDNWQRFENTYVYLENGKQYVLSGETDGNFTSIHNTSEESDNVVLWLVNPDAGFNKIMSDDKTGTTGTVFTWNSASGTYQLRVNTYRTVSTKSAWNIQIEEGNLRSTYSQNEADIESKVAEYKQTADQNYASLQSNLQTLDGTVKSNKSTADQTAAGFKTRIESLETYKDGESTRANQYFESAKTETARQLTAERTAIAEDYVAKSTYTSDVTGIRNDLTATTTTANTTKQNLASYQTSNDKAVASLQSNLQTANGNISSLQTKVEAVPGQITSAVSAVEGKIATEIGGRNYIRNYGLTATGWTQNTSGWSFEIVSDSTARSGQYLKATCTKAGGGGFYKNLFDFSDGRFWGKQMTWAMDVKMSKSRKIKVGPEWGDAAKLIDVTTEWQRNSNTFTVATTSTYKQWIVYGNGVVFEVGDIIYIRDVQLEDGALATSPVPAIEDTESDISKLNTTLTQTANGLEQLSTQVTSQGNTITSHTNSINSLTTGLSAKVSQTDFNTLSGRVTTAENNITAKANELSSKITSVQSQIPTETGLRNYALNTGTPKSLSANGELYDLSSAFDSIDDNANLIIEFDWSVTAPTSTSGFRINRVITYSDGTAAQWNNTIWLNNVSSDLSTSNGSGHYSGTFTKKAYNGTTVSSRYLNLNLAGANGTVTISNLTVRVGTLKGDWQPAPEDSDSKLTAAQSEIKQTTDAISASVSALDSSTVKTATLNLDNNGFVTKVGKTVNGNTLATMIAQNESDVQIIAKKMKVSGDMIVNGAITAEKLNINSLSALSAKLGDVTSGSITNTFSSGTRSGNIKIKDSVEITSTDTSNLLPEKAKENLVLSTGSLVMNASTSSDEATHSMLIMPETIQYTKNNYDTTRGGTNSWKLTHNGYYSMLQVDMVWQNVRLNNTSNLPYGIKANYVRIGNLVTISVNRQITNVAVVTENNLANETIPTGFRPISQAHLTLTGNTGSTIDATCICHLDPDGTIRFTNNKTGNRVWTGTVTYTCVEPMPYVKDLNNGSTI